MTKPKRVLAMCDGCYRVYPVLRDDESLLCPACRQGKPLSKLIGGKEQPKQH